MPDGPGFLLSAARLRPLRERLTALVDKPDRIRFIAAEAGISEGEIDGGAVPSHVWHSVLQEADRHGPQALDAVIERVGAIFPNRLPELRGLLAAARAAEDPATADTVLPAHAPGNAEAPTVPEAKAVLPARNPFFSGRERELKALHRALSSGAAALTQPAALSGLGGIGKTQTAIEYAWRHASDYTQRFFVRAASASDLETGYEEIARALELPEKDSREPGAAARAVKRWLEMHAGWLLILDNADDPEAIRSLLPAGAKGFILLTTRSRELHALAQPVRLDELPLEEAVGLLLKRSRKKSVKGEEKVAVEALAKALDGLPLALEQAGAYIAEQQVLFADYLKSYERRRLELLEKGRPRTGGYPASVATTWDVSFQVVEAESPAAAEVLRLSAFLDGDAIPYELLSEGAAHLGEEIAARLSDGEADPLRVAELLEPLARYSLIRIDVEARTFRVHRLVQEVMRARLDEAGQKARAERVVRALNAVFPPVEFSNWPACARLIEQVKVVRRWIDLLAPEGTEAGRLLNQGGYYLKELARYAEAEPLYRRGLELCHKALGSDHPVVATSLNNLALLLQATNRLEEAEPLMRRALAINEGAYGNDHPRLATILNNLAMLLKATNRLKEAELLMRRALELDEDAHGKDHPEVATDLNNLALLLQATNRLEEAEPLMRRALELSEAAYGKGHPAVAIGLNNLALLLKETNRLKEAEPLMRRALVIDEAAYGTDHPAVARDLNNLAQLVKVTNRLKEAEPLMRRALEIDEAAYGKDHPYVARDLDNLATLLQALNRMKEAEPLIRRALELHEAIYGKDHPYVARDLNNLAMLLQATNRFEEAEPLMRRSVEIVESSLGSEHPHTRFARLNLTLLERDLKSKPDPTP